MELDVTRKAAVDREFRVGDLFTNKSGSGLWVVTNNHRDSAILRCRCLVTHGDAFTVSHNEHSIPKSSMDEFTIVECTKIKVREV